MKSSLSSATEQEDWAHPRGTLLSHTKLKNPDWGHLFLIWIRKTEVSICSLALHTVGLLWLWHEWVQTSCGSDILRLTEGHSSIPARCVQSSALSLLRASHQMPWKSSNLTASFNLASMRNYRDAHIFSQCLLLVQDESFLNTVYWVLLFINKKWFMGKTDIKMIFRRAGEPHTNKQKIKREIQMTPKDRYVPIRTIYPGSINREGHSYTSVC